MTSEMLKSPKSSRIAFRLGQLLFLVAFVCFVVGLSTSHWVDRPVVDITALGITSKVTLHYGIFLACLQMTDSGETGKCDDIWKNLNYVDDHAARFVQALMVAACILFFIGLILEVIQLIPVTKYRNFIAQNRMVELFSAIGAVLALGGIVIFAGEIKNKAERVNGQDEEEVGWSFVMNVVGLGLIMLAVMTVTMFRELPIPKTGEKGGSWMRF